MGRRPPVDSDARVRDHPTLDPGAGPDSGRVRPPGYTLILVGLGVLVASVAALVVVLSRGDGSGGSAPTSFAVSAASSVSSSPPPSSSAPPSTAPSASTSPPSISTKPPADVRPIGATADSTLASQRGCDGQLSTYDAANAVDGDLQTAWAPAPDDGSGQHLLVDLGRSVELTEVGLVPGYAKVGPLRWNGCQPVSRFELNRQIVRVRYRFDDASMLEQSFSSQPMIQWTPVAVTTRTIDVEILSTRLPAGDHVDDDTLISEVGARGR